MNLINKGRFDAVLLGWTIPQDPDIYQVWHSSQAVEGGLNFTHYRNPEVDTLLEEARSLPDQDQRARLYWRIQEILDRDQPYCFLFVPYALPVVQRRFQGIEPPWRASCIILNNGGCPSLCSAAPLSPEPPARPCPSLTRPRKSAHSLCKAASQRHFCPQWGYA